MKTSGSAEPSPPGLSGDFYEALTERLQYISSYYDDVASHFEHRKRLMENNEEPFVDRRSPDDYDGEPAFLSEWMEADEFQQTTGVVCVILLSKTIENYLRYFVMREFALNTLRELADSLKAKSISPKNGKVMAFLSLLQTANWTKFSWSNSPVTKEEIEDVMLTRNAFIHDEQLDEKNVLHKHFETRRQHSAFSDLRWAELYGDEEFWNNPQKLIVTRASLSDAIDKVRAFCAYVESCRTS